MTNVYKRVQLEKQRERLGDERGSGTDGLRPTGPDSDRRPAARATSSLTPSDRERRLALEVDHPQVKVCKQCNLPGDLRDFDRWCHTCKACGGTVPKSDPSRPVTTVRGNRKGKGERPYVVLPASTGGKKGVGRKEVAA